MFGPLKFLDPYNKEDINVYFGRTEETDLLYDKVKRNPITLFYGLSGTGKTSLILCGLSNKFDDTDWMSLVIRRGNKDNIISSIQNMLCSHLQEKTDVFSALEKIYTRHYRPIYLIFDQFEELFIYGTKEEKNEFISFLLEVQKNHLYVKVILVLREEYFVHLDDFESRIPQIFQSRVRLEPMKQEKVAKLIIDMGAALKLKINPEVAAEVINHITVKTSDAAPNETTGSLMKKEIELPYLQVYFQEIMKNVQTKFTQLNGNEVLEVKKEDLPELGAINDVLSDFLDDSVKNISLQLAKKNLYLGERYIWQVLNTLVSYEGTKQEKSLAEIQTTIA
jgi:hypothetical protein